MEHLLKQGKNIVPDYVRVYKSMNGGWVDVHPWHGKHELKDNLVAGKILADAGFCIELLPHLHSCELELREIWLPDAFESKNPDIRINESLIGDIKTPDRSTLVKRSTIKRQIHSAAQQRVSVIILNYYDRTYIVQDIKKGIVGALQPERNKSIQLVWFITRNGNLFMLDRKTIFDDSIYEVLNYL